MIIINILIKFKIIKKNVNNKNLFDEMVFVISICWLIKLIKLWLMCSCTHSNNLKRYLEIKKQNNLQIALRKDCIDVIMYFVKFQISSITFQKTINNMLCYPIQLVILLLSTTR